jgi:diguanylate cyclase (GGDEF)-like protein
MNWAQLAGKRSLSARMVALSLALLLLVQAAVFTVVRASIEQSARKQIAQELQVGERVWRRLLDQNAERLAQGAALLAADFGFRSAVNSGDVETIRSVLDNHGARIGATVTALLNNQLTLLAVGEGQDAKATAPLISQIVAPLLRNTKGSRIALVNQMPYQFVMVPMKAPTMVGWVLMGFPIGQALVDEMRVLSDVHLALINPARLEAGKVVVSTLAQNALLVLQRSQGQVTELNVDGDVLVGRNVKLDAGNGELHTLLLRSFDDVVEPFRQAQFAMAWITALGVLLFGVGSFFAARWVTTPLRTLVSASEKLGRGDYETPMEHIERHGEIGDLAVAFDHMRVNIGAQQAEIRKLAYWDRLTGLPNRARFREAVQQAIAHQPPADGVQPDQIAVVVLDLDRFKLVNDVLGYAFGDRVLEAVARRLARHELHADDMVARLGGNEFAILLTQRNADDAMRVAQRIAHSFEAPLAFADQTIDLSAAIGISCWPGHAQDADALLSRAEVAMYSAKRRTTGIQLYNPALDSTSTQSLSLLGELRRALDQNELRLYLQPKIAQLQSSPNGAEALVRWQHPVRGLVPPMEFIPFAEQSGFVRQLTLWVFNEVASQWHALQSPGQAFEIAINLSTRDLLDPDFPSRLDAILVRHDVPASGLCLEITESAIMDDPQRAEATLNRLHERGFKLAIDDFGTGYSSLAYLKRLPVDQLKIDKSFVMAMEKIEGDQVIVRSTIDLAHNLGLTVVAEGVENAAIYQALKKLGCDETQGYFIGRPMPAGEFSKWRERWNDDLARNRRDHGHSMPMPLA